MSSYKMIIFFYLYQIFKIVLYCLLHSKNLFVVVYKRTNWQLILFIGVKIEDDQMKNLLK